MDRQTQRTVSTILSLVGILMFIAPSFDIVPRNIGNFTGIALLLISGTLYALPKKTDEQDFTVFLGLRR